nr:hypothetical protein [Streptomyces nodosus]
MTSQIAPVSVEPDTRDDVRDALGQHYTIRSSRVIDLNLFKVRVSSNVADFAGYALYTRYASPETACAYELVFVDLNRDPIDAALIEPLVDQGYRADRFRGGSYITHHFGPPAYLVTRGDRIYVFGRELERTLWPYFTKRLLTDFAIDHGLVHLKAAALVQPQGATLLFGRQKAGEDRLPYTGLCRGCAVLEQYACADRRRNRAWRTFRDAGPEGPGLRPAHWFGPAGETPGSI